MKVKIAHQLTALDFFPLRSIAACELGRYARA
jgi:hypothetical protein